MDTMDAEGDTVASKDNDATETAEKMVSNVEDQAPKRSKRERKPKRHPDEDDPEPKSKPKPNRKRKAVNADDVVEPGDKTSPPPPPPPPPPKKKKTTEPKAKVPKPKKKGKTTPKKSSKKKVVKKSPSKQNEKIPKKSPKGAQKRTPTKDTDKETANDAEKETADGVHAKVAKKKQTNGEVKKTSPKERVSKAKKTSKKQTSVGKEKKTKKKSKKEKSEKSEKSEAEKESDKTQIIAEGTSEANAENEIKNESKITEPSQEPVNSQENDTSEKDAVSELIASLVPNNVKKKDGAKKTKKKAQASSAEGVNAPANADGSESKNKTKPKTEKSKKPKAAKPDTVLVCDRCGHSTKSLKRLDTHMRKCHSENDEEYAKKNPYRCTVCEYRAKKPFMVRKHQQSHGMFMCAHCDTIEGNKEDLDAHLKQMHPLKPGNKVCKVCAQHIKIGVDIEEHEKTCTGKKPYVCDECNKEFRYRSSLKVHKLRKHDQGLPKKFECSLCEYKSEYRVRLVKHINSVHNQNRTRDVKCPQCEKMFFSEELMKRHLKLHTSVYPYSCSWCQKVFKTSDALKDHELTHQTGKPFVCDIDGCTKKFKKLKTLKAHQEECHRLNKKVKCKFPGCDAVFFKNSHLKRHETTHTGERRFPCDWPNCGKAFRHADNLKVHYRQHTNEKPIKCDLCDFACRQKSSLHWHQKRYHADKSKEKVNRNQAAPQENIQKKDEKENSIGNGNIDGAENKETVPGEVVKIDGEKTLKTENAAGSILPHGKTFADPYEPCFSDEEKSNDGKDLPTLSKKEKQIKPALSPPDKPPEVNSVQSVSVKKTPTKKKVPKKKEQTKEPKKKAEKPAKKTKKIVKKAPKSPKGKKAPKLAKPKAAAKKPKEKKQDVPPEEISAHILESIDSVIASCSVMNGEASDHIPSEDGLDSPQSQQPVTSEVEEVGMITSSVQSTADESHPQDVEEEPEVPNHVPEEVSKEEVEETVGSVKSEEQQEEAGSVCNDDAASIDSDESEPLGPVVGLPSTPDSYTSHPRPSPTGLLSPRPAAPLHHNYSPMSGKENMEGDEYQEDMDNQERVEGSESAEEKLMENGKCDETAAEEPEAKAEQVADNVPERNEVSVITSRNMQRSMDSGNVREMPQPDAVPVASNDSGDNQQEKASPSNNRDMSLPAYDGPNNEERSTTNGLPRPPGPMSLGPLPQPHMHPGPLEHLNNMASSTSATTSPSSDSNVAQTKEPRKPSSKLTENTSSTYEPPPFTLPDFGPKPPSGPVTNQVIGDSVVQSHSSEPSRTSSASSMHIQFTGPPQPPRNSSIGAFGQDGRLKPSPPTYMPRGPTDPLANRMGSDSYGARLVTEDLQSRLEDLGDREFLSQYIQEIRQWETSREVQSGFQVVGKPNADPLRRVSAIAERGYITPESTLATSQHQPQNWVGHEDRIRAWNQPSPILPSPELDTSSPLTKEAFLCDRDYALGLNPSPVRTSVEKRSTTTFTSQQRELVNNTVERYDMTDYLRHFNPTSGTGLDPRHMVPPPVNVPKHFDNTYRHPANMADYRTLPQTTPPDMFSAMSMNAAGLGLNKYYYPTEPMYRPQQMSATHPSAFLQNSCAQPTYNAAAFNRSRMYPPPHPHTQQAAYTYMDAKQYMDPRKLPQAVGVPTLGDRQHPTLGEREAHYFHTRSVSTESQMQDPYRRSVIYNMMNRYFE